MIDLLLIMRYRRGASHGLHALLGALEEHQTAVRFEVRFARSAAAVAEEIRAGLAGARRIRVLWSFHSPDAEAIAAELAAVRSEIDDPRVRHVVGGVHASAEPEAALDAGWDVAAVGEGETTVCRLVDAAGDPAGIPGLVWRDASGAVVRERRARGAPLDAYRAFSTRWRRFNAIEITRGCVHRCRYCQTSFMFSGRFRHRGVENVRWHVDQMRRLELRDVRFVTPSALSYGGDGDQPNLAAVEELLAECHEGIGPAGRVFLGSFPSEIRPEHVTRQALALIRRYCANDNIIVGAQSGSDRMLGLAGRGHGVEDVRRAVRVGLDAGFRINVDMIFGMPGEEPADAEASLRLVRELADLGARVHAHTFMPLPGTPWRAAPPGKVPASLMSELDRLARRGAIYGRWRAQGERAARLAAAAVATG